MYEQLLKLPVNGTYIEGKLTLPVKVRSIVIFAQGGGTFSDEYVALSHFLQREGYGTLLFNLLNEKENNSRQTDINLLAQRLVAVTLWITSNSEYRSLDIAYLGAGKGAAVALKAAAELNSKIRALVSCGGRTDLAAGELKKVICPTLLIAGELDFHTVKLNREALKRLSGSKEMAVIPGASHLFEEPGKLEQVARDIVHWLHKYLRTGDPVPEEELESQELESFEES